jgi:hypothetical protein
LPQRIVDILEAESLVNDGTGLLALQFGLLMLVTGHTPSFVEGVGRLVFLTGGGVLIGLAIGAVVAWFEKWVDDGPIEIVISILVPYAAYLMGDRAHVSGVIAVIACSMYMSRKNPGFMSPQVRLQTTAVWDALTFVLNGIVFVLIGLQLPYVMGQIGGMSRMVLLEYGVGFSHDRGANGVGIWRDLYRLCGAAMGAEGRSGGARATKVVCDRVGRDARSSVTGGGLVAVCTAGWQDVSAEEHDYLSGVLPDCGDTSGARPNAAVADSKARVVRDWTDEL